MKNRHKGNISAQNRRRLNRNKHRPTKQDDTYLLIDGNYTHYPVGFCKLRKRYISQGILACHKCKTRKCMHYRPFESEEITNKNVKTEDE